jgi:four helix bundle protein
MATINKFSDLPVWKLARSLNFQIISIIKILNENRDYALKAQMQKSSGSVMDHIAEGFERGGNKEFMQFLAISKGSVAELNSQLYRVLDSNYISTQEFQKLDEQCNEIRNCIGGFIRYLKQSEIKGIKYKQMKGAGAPTQQIANNKF